MSDKLRSDRLLVCFWALALVAVGVRTSAAADRAELDDRVRRAGAVFREMRDTPDHQIPASLVARSRCVAVIPNVIKAAWVFGGRYGRGVLSCRTKIGEWSPPVLLTMSGGSFGLQIGASSTDVVLFFMTTDSVRSLLDNKIKLSGEAGVAAGPVGRETEAATDARFRAEIYSYARSRGLFAGVSLAGSYVGVNRDDTRDYYGNAYSATGILFENKVSDVPKSAWMFLGALPRTQPAKAPGSKTPVRRAPAGKAPQGKGTTAGAAAAAQEPAVESPALEGPPPAAQAVEALPPASAPTQSPPAPPSPAAPVESPTPVPSAKPPRTGPAPVYTLPAH